MTKFSDFLVNLVTNSVLILLIGCGIMSPALAITQKLQLNTPTRYEIETTFSYDETNSLNKIQEHGQGQTQVIDSLAVSFYKPSGELIASYDNIVDGIAQGTYFEFNFDPTTQQLFGNLDLGGEIAGEMYLKGECDRELSLIKVQTSGIEEIIDRGKVVFRK